VPIDPDAGGAAQLPLLPPVDRFDGTAEPAASPSLDLDEGHHPITLDHEVDVAMARPEPALHYAPPSPAEPSLRYALSQFAERLPGR
jgi:hypothetical protein